MKYFVNSISIILFFLFLNDINAQFIQLGNKLVGTGYTGKSEQGNSVAISADGNTAIIGGFYDNNGIGASWIFTKANGVWIQQGNKLVANDAVGNSGQGMSVSLSADGNTAIVGGYIDNNKKGAAWIYTRQNGVWTQQGPKLVANDATDIAYQGQSVSISADGNTAIVGGVSDNYNTGAAWIYTRQNGQWTQQGPKLVGSGNTGSSGQGYSVSISADGNTAIVGGIYDNGGIGAAWIYTRQNGQWTQQGPKLVGSGNIGSAGQGRSVSISADGNTVILGGERDNSNKGAVWIFTRQNGVWTQQGPKLVGSDAIGNYVVQGWSVSLSADGNTAIVGGIGDNYYNGAAWIYLRQNGQWTQLGSKLVGSGTSGSYYAEQGSSVSLSADGNTAIVGGYMDNTAIGASWIFTTYNTISSTAGEGGSISPSGNVTVNYGNNQTFTITPNTGYHISDVLADGVSQGAVTSYTFPNVTADHTISASFAIDQFTITSSAGEHGTISPSGNTPVNYGQSQTYSFYPDQGYHVSDVVVDGLSKGSQPSYTFSNVVGSHTISVSFAPNLYIITSQAEPGGAITPTGNVEVQYGENQTFTITPNEGYHILDIVVSGVSKGAQSSYTFETVHENGSIIATFAINQYPITASSGNGGSISPPGTTYVSYRGSQTYTVTPNAGYHIQDVLIDGLSKGAITSYTFSDVVGEHTISALFSMDQFIIHASAGENGTISPDGDVTVNYGGSQSYTIIPNEGYYIKDIKADGQSVGTQSPYTFQNVTINHTITAEFAVYTYKITSSSGENGTITPLGETTLNWGASQTYTITPSQGYHVLDVKVDGTSLGAKSSYTFSDIKADHSISATFAHTTYSIMATAESGGIITPSGNIAVNEADTKSFTITPSPGYHIADVVVDEQSKGPITSYTFTDIHENHTISATFSIDQFTITATQSEHGKVTPEGVTNVSSGASQTYSITPDQGYTVQQVLADNQSVGALTSYTFTNVTGNHTITASFAIMTYKITSTSGSNGTITPSGEVNVNYGSSQEYTITPSSGYHILDVIVDGQSKGAVSTYKFENVSSDHTISAQFEVDTPEELPVPVAVSPKAGVILYTNTPTLYWSAGVNTTGLSYRVKYSTDPGNTNQNGDLKIADIGSSMSYTLPQLQWGKTYYWQVQSVKGSASSAYSAIESFKVVEEQVVVNPEVPIAAWPLSGSTVYLSSTTLTWYMLSGWSNISSYTLKWGEGSTLSNVVNGITNMTYYISGLLPGHPYSWTVEAVDRHGNHSSPSALQSFMTSGGSSNKPYTPVQACPVGGTIVYTSSPVLTWYMLQEGFKITSYKVRYSKNPDMTISTEISTAGPVCAMTLTGLEKGRTYYWQVQSFDGQIYSDPQTPPASFTIYSDQVVMTPVILSPQGSVGLKATQVDLSWAVKRSSDKMTYDIQYSSSPDFSNSVEVKNIKELSYKAVDLSSSTYYWRVRSKSIDGLLSEYSPIGKFSLRTLTGITMDRLNEHEFSLLQNYPNPFNPTTSIIFNLAEDSYITLEVFNSIGKSVGKVFEGHRPKGLSTMQFNAEELPSGIYFYKIIAIGQNGNTNYDIKKMMLLK